MKVTIQYQFHRGYNKNHKTGAWDIQDWVSVEEVIFLSVDELEELTEDLEDRERRGIIKWVNIMPESDPEYTAEETNTLRLEFGN